MWAAISNDSKTELVNVPGNLTAVRYRDEILRPHLMHVIDRQKELFQQDNARPQTARLAMDYLEENTMSQFSTLPVTLKLVPCMTTTRGQHCSTPPRHRLNQFSNIISWYCSPHLFQHLTDVDRGFSNDSKTELVNVPGNLTAVRYRDEIFRPHLIHLIDRQRELFQQDNARPFRCLYNRVLPSPFCWIKRVPSLTQIMC
jgi:hypothetical protein